MNTKWTSLLVLRYFLQLINELLTLNLVNLAKGGMGCVYVCVRVRLCAHEWPTAIASKRVEPGPCEDHPDRAAPSLPAGTSKVGPFTLWQDIMWDHLCSVKLEVSPPAV